MTATLKAPFPWFGGKSQVAQRLARRRMESQRRLLTHRQRQDARESQLLP